MNEQLQSESDGTIMVLAVLIAVISGSLVGLILAVLHYLYPSIPQELVMAGAGFTGVTNGVISAYAMRYVVATVQVFTAKKMRKIGVSTRGHKKTWYVDE